MELNVDQKKIEHFCKLHHVRKLSFFGSVLRADFRPDSDIDVLIEFQPNHLPGLLGMAKMQRELAAILGRSVDLRTPEDLSRYFRQDVLAKAQIQYAA